MPLDFLTLRQPSLCEANHVVSLKDSVNPLKDIAAEVMHALDQPLEFPPFHLAMIEGDRIALAVDASIPGLQEVIVGAIDYLLAHHIAIEDISVVLSTCEPATLAFIRDQLPTHLHQKLAVYIHNPSEQNELGYLAATSEDALPIYVNRRLLDADVVLPITLYHSHQTIDYFGITGIFPLFADSEVMKRCNTLSNLGAQSQSHKRKKEAEEATWLLGIQCILKAVPAGDGKLLNVIAGVPSALEQLFLQDQKDHSKIVIDQLVDIAIAEVDGDANEQTWSNVARALHTARSAIRTQGTIVLRTRIDQKPGPSLRKLGSLDAPEKIEKQLSKESYSDTLTASLLCEYSQGCRIYLQSKLPQDAVEDMGIGYVTDDHQLEKLVSGHERCLWLPSAQHYNVQHSSAKTN
jgi:hypothetical protein